MEFSADALAELLSGDTINYIIFGVLSYIALLWIAIILWVTKDITNRTNSLFFQIFSILLIIFLTPLFGLVIYLIIRPSRTLIEKYYEELEKDLLEQWLKDAMITEAKKQLAAEGTIVEDAPAPKKADKKAAAKAKKSEKASSAAGRTIPELEEERKKKEEEEQQKEVNKEKKSTTSKTKKKTSTKKKTPKAKKPSSS